MTSNGSGVLRQVKDAKNLRLSSIDWTTLTHAAVCVVGKDLGLTLKDI